MRCVIFILTFILSIMLFGQERHQCSAQKSRINVSDRSGRLSVDQISQAEEYDVHFYFLDLELNNTSVDIDGRVEIHAHSKVAVLDTFLVELHEDLMITAIKLNGLTVVPFTRVGSAVIVPCNFSLDDAFYYEFTYSGSAPDAQEGALGGGGLVNSVSRKWEDQITWSLSEPFSAYEWFVCKQWLTDKADSVKVYITCDATCMAGSQGVLKDVVDVGADKKRLDYPFKSSEHK